MHFGEVAQDIYDRAVVYIDSKASAATELADLQARTIGEVGEVIRIGKRTENERITIFQSLGKCFNKLFFHSSLNKIFSLNRIFFVGLVQNKLSKVFRWQSNLFPIANILYSAVLALNKY